MSETQVAALTGDDVEHLRSSQGAALAALDAAVGASAQGASGPAPATPSATTANKINPEAAEA